MTSPGSSPDVLAERLDAAQRQRTATSQPSALHPLGVDDAYRVQHALIARRRARGEHLVGLKLGFTSRAKAVQMGVSDVIVGTLTREMLIADGEVFDPASAIHPRIEPEVAYRLDDGRVTAVAPALEIIDSRYADFRFDLGDVIADNTSACAVVLGAWRPVTALDNRAVTLDIDGRLAQSGSTAAILGDPMRAVVTAERLASAHRFAPLRDGILLAGAATAAVAMPDTGVVEASIAGLGRVSVRVARTGAARKGASS